MNTSTNQAAYRDAAGRVRTACLDDLPALQDLIVRTDAVGAPWLGQSIQHSLDRGRLLVLDDDGALRAAAILGDGDTQQAQLELLLIEPEAMGHGLEERMAGVAGALRDAFEHGRPHAGRTGSRGRR
jgi:hypothetical protein